MPQILPFYLICDEPGSMKGELLRAINASLPDIHSEVASSPVVADKTQFCIIGFSGNARTVLPLPDLSTRHRHTGARLPHRRNACVTA